MYRAREVVEGREAFLFATWAAARSSSSLNTQNGQPHLQSSMWDPAADLSSAQAALISTTAESRDLTKIERIGVSSSPHPLPSQLTGPYYSQVLTPTSGDSGWTPRRWSREETRRGWSGRARRGRRQA